MNYPTQQIDVACERLRAFGLQVVWLYDGATDAYWIDRIEGSMSAHRLVIPASQLDAWNAARIVAELTVALS